MSIILRLSYFIVSYTNIIANTIDNLYIESIIFFTGFLVGACVQSGTIRLLFVPQRRKYSLFFESSLLKNIEEGISGFVAQFFPVYCAASPKSTLAKFVLFIEQALHLGIS